MGLCNVLNTEVESSIRRYRARFCNGVRLPPTLTLASGSPGPVPRNFKLIHYPFWNVVRWFHFLWLIN
jgi:hypothetical protein